MKKLSLLVAALMMVFGVAGNAMAAFELGNLQLVAYEEEDNTLPVGTAGYEVHYDLGATLAGGTWDTGIALGDFDVDTWDDVYVGIFGGGYSPDATSTTDALFASSADTFSTSAASLSPFRNAALSASSMFGPVTPVQAKTGGTYYNYMIQTGNIPGAYAGILYNTGNDFGGELQLADNSILTMGMYSLNDAGDLSKLGIWTLDSTGTSLVASFSPVPVPAAVWLLGSGLVGLIAIRRRKI